MPELPEVETTRRGIAPWMLNQRITAIRVRQPRLRWQVPDEVISLRNQTVLAVERRGKFLLITLPRGQLLLHLGMSGSLRVLSRTVPPGPHDHVDILLDNGRLVRFNDPRRFGALLWTPTPGEHALLSRLGPEPLSPSFSGDYLYQRSRQRRVSVKPFIMTNGIVVGVGNIYAQESLFMAGIHPSRQAGKISRERYERLAEAIRQVLSRAIEAGGTTLKDFIRTDGQPGYFSQSLAVYGRADEPCLKCGRPLKSERHGQRSTVWCGHCQR